MMHVSWFGALLSGALLVAACGSSAPRSRTSDGALADSQTAPAARAAERAPRRVVVNGVDLTGIGYDKGSPTAPVVVVDFSDFGCPFCASFTRETEPSIEREYVQTGKVFFKYVPFVTGMFPNGGQAARAGECAGEQGRFWAMHDTLYDEQGEWKKAISPYAVFQRYATSLSLDRAAFSACYTRQEVHRRTQQANDAADRLGVRVTPSFVVNGRPVEGALPLPQFRQLLDDALKEAK